jgi:hypothetical protein
MIPLVAAGDRDVICDAVGRFMPPVPDVTRRRRRLMFNRMEENR